MKITITRRLLQLYTANPYKPKTSQTKPTKPQWVRKHNKIEHKNICPIRKCPHRNKTTYKSKIQSKSTHQNYPHQKSKIPKPTQQTTTKLTSTINPQSKQKPKQNIQTQKPIQRPQSHPCKPKPKPTKTTKYLKLTPNANTQTRPSMCNPPNLLHKIPQKKQQKTLSSNRIRKVKNLIEPKPTNPLTTPAAHHQRNLQRKPRKRQTQIHHN